MQAANNRSGHFARRDACFACCCNIGSPGTIGDGRSDRISSFYSAFQIGHEAFQQLMDRELPDDILRQIESTAISHPAVRGTHELRTRQSGHMRFVQMHLELDENISLKEAHEIADSLEQSMHAKIPRTVNIMVHVEPDVPGKRKV